MSRYILVVLSKKTPLFHVYTDVKNGCAQIFESHDDAEFTGESLLRDENIATYFVVEVS